MEENSSVSLNRQKQIRSDHSAIRQSFRVSVQLEDGIFAVLDGVNYPVEDISPEGINTLCQDSSRFTLGQVIKNCELIIPGDTVKGLSARVIHGSWGPEGKWTNGIQWVDLPDTALDTIVQQVSKMKNKFRQMGPDISG